MAPNRSPKGRENLRKAGANYQKARREAGEVKKTFWLAPDAQVDLARLKAKHHTNDAALAAALALAAAQLT